MNNKMALSQDTEMEDLSQYSQEEDEEEEESKRRQLRHAYRNLINRTTANPDDESTLPPTETLDEARELFSKVTRTQEAVLDSKFLLLMTTRGRKCTMALPIALHAFDAEEFASRALSMVGAPSPITKPLDSEAWTKLGELSGEALKRSAPFWYLYGSAGIVPPRVRQARRIMVETPDKPATIAKKVSSVDCTSKEKTTEHVSYIHQLLKSYYAKLRGPLPYFEFVLHPRSFAKTCENIFHLSFLINQGLARIFENDNLLLVEPVERTSESTSAQATDASNMSSVFAMTLTMKQWREAVEALGITEPAIDTKVDSSNNSHEESESSKET